MRANEDVKGIVDFLVIILSNTDSFSSEIVEKSIDILAFLVDWNKLEYFSSCLPLVEPFINSKDCKISAISFFFSYIHKGMSAKDRI